MLTVVFAPCPPEHAETYKAGILILVKMLEGASPQIRRASYLEGASKMGRSASPGKNDALPKDVEADAGTRKGGRVQSITSASE